LQKAKITANERRRDKYLARKKAAWS